MPSLPIKLEHYEKLLRETLTEENVFIAFRDKMMYELSYELGFRPMEVRCIKVEHINFQEKTVFIPAENNKERHSDSWLIPEIVFKKILIYIERTKKFRGKSKWLFPSCFNEERKQDIAVDNRQHQRNFSRRLKKLGLLHVSFIDKQGTPRYNYNLYSLRKRYGSRIYKITKCPKKTAIMLRQRDRTLKSVWNYVFMEEEEEVTEIMKEIYPKTF